MPVAVHSLPTGWPKKKRLPLAEQCCDNCNRRGEVKVICPYHNIMLPAWCLDWR